MRSSPSAASLHSYLETLSRQDLITEFDEVMWYGTEDQERVRAGASKNWRMITGFSFIRCRLT